MSLGGSLTITITRQATAQLLVENSSIAQQKHCLTGSSATNENSRESPGRLSLISIICSTITASSSAQITLAVMRVSTKQSGPINREPTRGAQPLNSDRTLTSSPACLIPLPGRQLMLLLRNRA